MAVREPLSVIVLTRNEEKNLGRCLASIAWAEEIVVVDSESTDRTREIAERGRARVIVRPWPGFKEQWTFALAQASHLWVLVLAADEWLPEDTAHEIRTVLEAPLADGYCLDRITAFSGAFVRRAWHPDRQLRLFRKDRGSFEGGLVHESVQLAEGCRVERLRGKLLHLTYRSIHEFLARMNRYTDLAAATLRSEGKRFSTIGLLVRPPAAFVKYYVLRRGFLDGMRGLVASAGAGAYVFLKLAKLWELGRESDPSFLQAAGATPEDPDPGALPSQSG